jgi:hypothetical protein
LPRLPFITLFDSWEDLIDKLGALDLEATSRAMRAHAELLEAQVVRGWRTAVDRVAEARDARDAEEAAGKAAPFPPADEVAGAQQEGGAAVERRYAARMDALYGTGAWELY